MSPTAEKPNRLRNHLSILALVHQPIKLALAVLSCGACLFGQDDATFRTDVKVVNLLATVRTKKGAIVRDLDKENFTVVENGRPQAIRYFSRESDLPLTLGLLIDVSASQERVLDAEKIAAGRFFDQVLREDKDQVFLIQFDLGIQIAQELTNSRRKLVEALTYVETPTRRELAMQEGGGTVLHDVVIKASNDIMAKQTNRKALIILSDGVDVRSQATLTNAVEAAQKTGTLVYSILFADSAAYGIPLGPLFGRHSIPMGGPDGRGTLVRLAKETGGSFFEVSKKLSIEQIFDQIQEELRSQYSLGFVSNQPARLSEFRKLQLTTSRKDLTVQTRDKYWAQR